MPSLDVYARSKKGCKGYGSYAGQLIEGLERWQKQWTRLRVVQKSMHEAIESSAEEAMA
jgi:hypothetical protein